jgi:hypothetical protein
MCADSAVEDIVRAPTCKMIINGQFKVFQRFSNHNDLVLNIVKAALPPSVIVLIGEVRFFA